MGGLGNTLSSLLLSERGDKMGWVSSGDHFSEGEDSSLACDGDQAPHHAEGDHPFLDIHGFHAGEPLLL